MAGHAPGPWRVMHRGSGQGIAIMAHDETYPVARAYSHEKHVKGQGFSRLFDANANARLIAAAPDLLGACKQTLDLLGSTDQRTFEDEDRVYEAVFAAIEKALRGS